jgi:hypothetical protein
MGLTDIASVRFVVERHDYRGVERESWVRMCEGKGE